MVIAPSSTSVFTLGILTEGFYDAVCPSGDTVVSGGWESAGNTTLNGEGPGPGFSFIEGQNFPTNSWAVDVYDNSAVFDSHLQVYAICVNGS